MDEGRRDRNALYVVWLAGEREVLPGFPEPPERVKGLRPLLIRLGILEQERRVVLGIVEGRPEQGDEPVAVAIGQLASA
jgi:hypothetical protein